ncbi:MAG: protein kinase [Sandaracinaceae bacterium]
MSWWRRLVGAQPPAPPTPAPADPTPARSPSPESGEPEDRLEALSRAPDSAPEEVLELLEELALRGREVLAIDLARRYLTHRPDAVAVHLRVAEALASRGDDDGAGEVVAPFLDREDAPLDLLMLGAELAERRGDPTAALSLYERVVARDLDYPRARQRVQRLREGETRRRDVGATLLAEGALTRGRYRLEQELGRGGAGTVFLAWDIRLSRPVALKVYHRRGRGERERLLVEARTPARLEHPGVVRILDLDAALGALAMERVRGGSVRAALNRGEVKRERVRRWFVTAAHALAFVHRSGVVHRDLKPSNLLLRQDDRAVLTDFGLATRAGSRPGPRAGEGTLAYMPPEQRAGEPADPAMDLYALGASLREILTALGEAPAPWWAIADALTAEDPARRPGLDDLVRVLQP